MTMKKRFFLHSGARMAAMMRKPASIFLLLLSCVQLFGQSSTLTGDFKPGMGDRGASFKGTVTVSFGTDAAPGAHRSVAVDIKLSPGPISYLYEGKTYTSADIPSIKTDNTFLRGECEVGIRYDNGRTVWVKREFGVPGTPKVPLSDLGINLPEITPYNAADAGDAYKKSSEDHNGAYVVALGKIRAVGIRNCLGGVDSRVVEADIRQKNSAATPSSSGKPSTTSTGGSSALDAAPRGSASSSAGSQATTRPSPGASGSSSPVYDSSGKTYTVTNPNTGETLYFDNEQQRNAYMSGYSARQQAASQARIDAEKAQQVQQTRQRLEAMQKQQAVIQTNINQAASSMAGVVSGSYATDHQKNMAIAQSAGQVAGTVAGSTGSMGAGIGAGVGVAVLGSMLGSSQESRARKEAEEAKKAAEAEQRRLEAEIEAMRIAAIRDMRRLMLNEFTDTGIPLSSHKTGNNTYYYFAYRVVPGIVEAARPKIFVTNLFPVSKYSDGSWPFTNTVKKELLAAGGQGELVLTGMYDSEELGRAWHSQFLDLAKVSEVSVEQIFYQGRKSSVAGSSTAASSASGSSDDFWETGSSAKSGQQTKSAPAAKPAPKPASSTADDDFWNK